MCKKMSSISLVRVSLERFDGDSALRAQVQHALVGAEGRLTIWHRHVGTTAISHVAMWTKPPSCADSEVHNARCAREAG